MPLKNYFLIPGSKLPPVASLQTKDSLDPVIPECAPSGSGPPGEDANIQSAQKNQGNDHCADRILVQLKLPTEAL